MTLLDVLTQAGFAASGLLELLGTVKQKYPDLAPQVDKVMAGITGAVAPENLVALAEALPRELANIGSGKLDPRRHPSDGA